MANVRVFSFGGGVDSHAVIVLQSQGKLPEPYDYYIFANVGANSENPYTLEYIERYTKPFCERFGIKFVEVQKQRGRGNEKHPDTLLENIQRSEKSIVIPVRMGHNGAPGHRNCTDDHKITVVDTEVKRMGYTSAVIGLGIGADEMQRVRSTEWYTDNAIQKKREYPLVSLHLTRAMCIKIITDAGLPEPPKSSCWFCPFHKRSEWIDMKMNQPELFAQAVEVERIINAKRTAMRRDYAYIHPDCVPLDRAVADQPRLFPDETDDNCDSGYCMT